MSAPPIPLYHPDLTQQDRDRVLQALTPPWQDEAACQQLEQAWHNHWQRPVVAFAHPTAAIQALAELFSWRMGDAIALSPLANPEWSEALQHAGLYPAWLDLEIPHGLGSGQPMGLACCAGQLQGWMRFGFAGQQDTTPLPPHVTPLEVLDHCLIPASPMATSSIGLLHLGANGPLQGGEITLVSMAHASEVEQLRTCRQQLPSRSALALALSQTSQYQSLMASRAQRAQRYLDLLRPRNRFSVPTARQHWSRFTLWMTDHQQAQELYTFLHSAQIGCCLGHPLPPPHEGAGLHHWYQHALQVPLYAALKDGDQKRIINRIHRWVERG
ncbi:hypothetical protein [Magnetococcus sp. PR-3]|uniref:hypothetical protein n=1 Tax=Magnetococcus sp. PR-3 TaxID=3120355 RepID=UPI002FCE1723